MLLIVITKPNDAEEYICAKRICIDKNKKTMKIFHDEGTTEIQYVSYYFDDIHRLITVREKSW